MSILTRPRLLAFSTVVGLGMLAAAILLRPLWRDEYWGLYFSAVDLPLAEAMETRMVRDVHPPLYFILEHFWRAPLPDSMLWARAFNIAALLVGAAAVWLLGRRRAGETGLFLALCATTYWVIYFGTEVRMYALVFAMCAVSLFAARAALEAKSFAGMAGALAAFWLSGAIASASHYFGTLWTAALGLSLGVSFLLSGRPGAFIAVGMTSVAAVAPTLLWIFHANPQTRPGAVAQPQAFGDMFSYAANQFLRGVVVKTFGSNLPAFIAGAMAIPVLARRRDPIDAVLIAAVAITVVIAFSVHLFVLPSLIKERAFIVIMPALIYLCVRALGAITPELRRAAAIAALVPAAAIVSPFLFIPEYFKDREQLGVVRKEIEGAGDCAGAPVLVYYRPSEQAGDFHPFMIATALRGAARGGDLIFVDAEKNSNPAWRTECRVRALALVLGKGETVLHATARETLKRAGAPLDQWEERRLGKGRSLIWLAPVSDTTGPSPSTKESTTK